ncbi:MAG: carboxypeptidase-like regulatory domain-containing protein, partial [Tannerella sp.]|nr:carboxypeptidase-like regulatory domain-containing protein [Tannerella sp.]
VKELLLSCIGFYNAKIPVTKNRQEGQTFFIIPESYNLSEIQVFSWRNPRDLIKAALSKIEDNYVMNPAMLTGFYRETIQKRRRYINISEAVIDIYKGPYNQPADMDRVRVLKGRKLISPKMADTLSVKLQGGPNMAIYMDVVKNPDLLLDQEVIQYYTYKMGESTSIDDRLQYVVHFEPQMLLPYPLYSGTFYIDRETLSFTRAEFKMDMRDKQKVTGAILIEKPRGLRFTPEEVSYVITYKYLGGKTRLNYIRNDIKFKCDWKRKLFATNYSVTGETVITDRDERNIRRIPVKEAFSIRKSLSQEVALYQDENFWGYYNIIEPTESLENAVNKLKKQHLKSQ